MYTREIQEPISSPIENGIPLSGTWNKAFSHVNLLEIHKPYSMPLPRWLKDFRIKEWECFSVQNESIFLEVLLGNVKLFQMAHVFLYNKETEESYTFKKILPGNNWRMPKSLNHASVECRTSHALLRIHTWLKVNMILLDIDISATKRQPAFTAHIAYHMEDHEFTPMAVSLNFTGSRNMYSYKSPAIVRGDIVLGGNHIKLNPVNCTGVFRDYKGFFPYQMKSVYCGSMGFDGEGRRFGFHIAENQARETRKNNENVLWVNKGFTPLPPVRITMPNGPESDWVIQDLDGMVDLVFTPKVINRYGINLLVTRGDFFIPMGYYNGMLVSANEEQIQVRNQWGLGEKIYVRV